MFTERADAVIMCVASHDAQKAAKQKQKCGGPEPMELGTTSRRTLTRSEYEKLRAERACFICKKPSHIARNCPQKKKNSGNGMGR